VNIDDLSARLRALARERDWDQFHAPKNLAMALAVEAAELMEHFQWLTQTQSAELPPAAKGASCPST
jgi:dCTP diphosphatase